jgi:hypothetical protein
MYYLVRFDTRTSFTVSKWEGKKQPDQIYQVRDSGRGLRCNCPAAIYRKGQCKHVKMVKKAEYEKDFNIFEAE